MRDGTPLGTVVWLDTSKDLAIIDISDQSRVSPQDARAWTGSWNATESVPVTGAINPPPEVGTSNIWVSGAMLGTVGGQDVRILSSGISLLTDEAVPTMDIGAEETNTNRPIMAAGGQSGSGVYLERDGTYLLWGVLSGSHTQSDTSCPSRIGTVKDCTYTAVIVPIGPALDAGFSVAQYLR